MKELIEKLKAAEQNTSGMFEIDEDTICKLMAVLAAEPTHFYANGAYYNTVKAAFKDGAEEVISLYER